MPSRVGADIVPRLPTHTFIAFRPQPLCPSRGAAKAGCCVSRSACRGRSRSGTHLAHRCCVAAVCCGRRSRPSSATGGQSVLASSACGSVAWGCPVDRPLVTLPSRNPATVRRCMRVGCMLPARLLSALRCGCVVHCGGLPAGPRWHAVAHCDAHQLAVRVRVAAVLHVIALVVACVWDAHLPESQRKLSLASVHWRSDGRRARSRRAHRKRG